MIRPEALVIALGAAALFPIQHELDATRGAPPDIIETLPPARLLPILAMGHRETLADLLEIRATNFLLARIDPSRTFTDAYRDHLWDLYFAILALDPNDAGACWRGGLLLGAVGNRPDDAIALLRRGLGLSYRHGGKECPPLPGVDPHSPQRWRLYSEQAATYFLMHANRTFGDERRAYIRKAGRLWIEAAEAGGPEFYAQAGKRLATREIGEEESLRHEATIWKYRHDNAGNAQTRKLAVDRLQEVASALLRLKLQQRVDAMRRLGHPVHSLAELHVKIPPDPLGGTFSLRGGHVAAPPVEARRLQRQLEYRWHRFREEHPDQRPTLADLLQGRSLPDYLQVTITDSRVSVAPKP